MESEVPDAGAVEEAGDDAVFAHLEDGSEPAGDERGGGPRAFDGDRLGERGGIVAEDRPEGDQPAGAIGDERAVEAGEGLDDRGVEVEDGPARGGPADGAASRTAWGAISRPTALGGSPTTTNRPPWRASARSSAVWNRTRANGGGLVPSGEDHELRTADRGCATGPSASTFTRSARTGSPSAPHRSDREAEPEKHRGCP